MKSRSVSSAAIAALVVSILLVRLAAAGTARLTAEPFAPLPLLYASTDRSGALDVSSREDAPPADLLTGSDAVRRAADAVTPGGARNPRTALVLSLLLPGAGELYLGQRGRATGFFIAEGAVWANYIGWQISGHLRQDDYIEQAQLGAGVGVGSGSDDYWRLVGQYERSSGTGPGAYEETLRREARLQYPDDPAQQDRYVAERLPTGDRAWSWSASDLQAYYRKTRQNANRAFSRAKYSFGFAVLNRLLSALDTQILHRSRGGRAESRAGEGETRILSVTTADGGGALLIQRRF